MSPVTAPWSPLREGNESKQAAEFIRFYRVVSFYGKQSKHNKTMALTATPTVESSANIPLGFPCVLIMLLGWLCRRKLQLRSLLIIFPDSCFIFGSILNWIFGIQVEVPS